MNGTDYRFRKAVGRVLIALSFKSFRRRNERYRRRERSDCSEAFILPVVEEERFSIQEDTLDVRSRISGGVSGSSDESDAEPSSPLPRRGRRQAICGSKSLEADEGDLSPSASCEKEMNVSTLDPQDQDESKRRCSADVDPSYPCELLCQVRCKKAVAPLLKRNTIADFANTKAYQESTASLISACDQDKKMKNSFSILKLREKRPGRMKNDLPLAEVLLAIKPSHFKDAYLISHKDSHWLDLISEDTVRGPIASQRQNIQVDICSISDTERKRREAVWELFRSECVFLIDHLMVLKHCFMEPMKKVQVEGHLMFAEPQDLFGNLDELCYVSYTFSRDFISLLLKDKRASDFGRTEILIKALRRFCQLTRDGEVYHEYCLNYSKAISYLEQLRKNEDFCEFEKWCGQDPRCHRLQLPDLLISPMQHCTKVPLLLNNIRRYTEEPSEQFMLTESLEKLESSLENLEAKMLWLKNFERVQEIQQQIVWQPISELDPRAFIPEFLRATLSRQPCERLLCSSKRRLLYEGPTTLLEVSKAIDMYMFLFDDLLLLSRVKKAPRKKPGMVDQSSPFARIQTDGAIFVVHRQPIALDRFVVHDVRPLDGSGGVFWDYVESSCDVCPPEDTGSIDACKDSCLPHLYNDCSPSAQKSNLLFGCVSTATVLKNAFVIVQVNRFQQIIGVYTLQAPNYSSKAQWMSRLHDAQESYKESCRKSSLSKRLSRECAVDITVQCENESYMESPDERGVSIPSFKFFNSQKVPSSLLLGVPFNDHTSQQHSPMGEDEDEISARNRKIRSSSSDAAAAMQQEEYEGDYQEVQRRTSDPLCQHGRVNSGEEAVAEDQAGSAAAADAKSPHSETTSSLHCHPILTRARAVPMKTLSSENIGPATSSDNKNRLILRINPPPPHNHRQHHLGHSRSALKSPCGIKEQSERSSDQSFTVRHSSDFLSPPQHLSHPTPTTKKPLHASLKVKRKAMMKAIHERSQSLDNTCPL